MVKTDFNTIPACHCCNKPSTELHEVIPGRVNRNICIKYHLQVLLCRACHDRHHTNIPESVEAICNSWGIDRYRLNMAVKLGQVKKLQEISDHIIINYWRKNYDVNI